MINSMLNKILIYWASIAKIPKGILSKIRKICFQFIWSRKKELIGIPLVRWSWIAMSQPYGGWGVKNIY